MDSVKADLIEKLTWRRPKEEMQALCEREEFRPHLRAVCLSDDLKLNWRAAWILGSFPQEDLEQIFPDPEVLIACLNRPSKKDGYWREILKIIARLPLNENQEGLLYEAALKLWENLALASAVRLQALYALARVARNYPELKQEILAYQDAHYMQGISPGISNQVQKLFARLS